MGPRGKFNAGPVTPLEDRFTLAACFQSIAFVDWTLLPEIHTLCRSRDDPRTEFSGNAQPDRRGVRSRIRIPRFCVPTLRSKRRCEAPAAQRRRNRRTERGFIEADRPAACQARAFRSPSVEDRGNRVADVFEVDRSGSDSHGEKRMQGTCLIDRTGLVVWACRRKNHSPTLRRGRLTWPNRLRRSWNSRRNKRSPQSDQPLFSNLGNCADGIYSQATPSRLVDVENGPDATFRRLPIPKKMTFRRKNTWRSGAGRLMVLAVATGVVFAFIPVPASRPKHEGKDKSRPFPCQDRPCGCGSADQCWKQCCCFTNSEKVAWAQANSVSVPDEVIAAAKTERPKPKERCSACCGASAGDAVCDSSATQPETAPPDNSGDPPSLRGVTTHRSVLIIAAQKCQGHHWHWVAVPWAVDLASFCVGCVPASITRGIELDSDDPVRGSIRPPVPPPR